MTLIVGMSSKIADCGYYASVMFGSLIWEGESSSSEPAHRYKATKGHSHKPSGGADRVSACQLIQYEQTNQHRKRIHQTFGWNAVFQSLIYSDVSGTSILILKQATNLHPATACIFAGTHIKRYELWDGGNLTSDIHHSSLGGRSKEEGGRALSCDAEMNEAKLIIIICDLRQG